MKSPKAKIPTRFRMSFVHRFPHYSPRLVFSFGLIELICGTVNVFLTVVLYRYDRDNHGWHHHRQAEQFSLTWLELGAMMSNYMRETGRHTYLNVWIVLSGLITLLVSCRPYSRCHIRLFFTTSLVSVLLSAAYAILLSNIVIQQSIISTLVAGKAVDPYRAVFVPEPVEPRAYRSGQFAKDDTVLTNRANLVLILHVFMLSFCVVTFVISIVSFSLVWHHLCTCSPFGWRSSADYHIYDTSTWSRKQRIIQWVVQQSQLASTSDLFAPTSSLTCHQSANPFSIVLHTAYDSVLVPHCSTASFLQPAIQPKTKLLAHQSSITNSSRISMLDK